MKALRFAIIALLTLPLIAAAPATPFNPKFTLTLQQAQVVAALVQTASNTCSQNASAADCKFVTAGSAVVTDLNAQLVAQQPKPPPTKTPEPAPAKPSKKR